MFTEALEGLGTLLETTVLGTFNKERRGSHSLLAKDEEYKNKHFNKKAIESAIFADKLIVLALFTENHETDKGSIHSINIHKLLSGLLSHPLSGELTNKLDKFYRESTLVAIKEEPFSAILTISSIFERIKADNSNTDIEDLKEILMKHNLCLRQEDFTENTTIEQACKRLNIEPVKVETKEDDIISNVESLNNFYNIPNYIEPIDNTQYKLNIPVSISKPISKETENRYHWIINLFNKKDEDMVNDYGYDAVDIIKDRLDGFVKGFYPKFLIKEEEINNYSTLAIFFEHYKLGEPQIEYLETAEMLSYYISKENSMEYKVKRAHELFIENYIKEINPEK